MAPTNPNNPLPPAPFPTTLDQVSQEWITNQLLLIESHLKKEKREEDVLTIFGFLGQGVDIKIRLALEHLEDRRSNLLVILDTPGGLVSVVQRIVKTLRSLYNSVRFLIPNRAMSAGTVLAMSGDAILMDYFSCLGPIDPQLGRDGQRFVPALSYLRQYEILIEKSKKKGGLTSAEMILLNKLDLAELHQIDLAAKLSVSLIEDWLSKYKFKDWEKDGEPVNDEKKKKRAKEIAEKLNDHQKWHTHGHGIHKDTLENDLRLQIEDYGQDPKLKSLIWRYYWAIKEYAMKQGVESFVHSRSFV